MSTLEIITIGLLLLVVALYVCDRMVAAWERFAAWFAWWNSTADHYEWRQEMRRISFDEVLSMREERRQQSPRSLP